MQGMNFQGNPVRGLFNGIRPEERLTVSEWADKHRIVEGGPRPGPYSTAETPYLREIMDCLSARSPYRKVVYMKAAQIGASEAGYNWLGYSMDISPCVIMAVMPTEGQMKTNSKLRIEPMINATPRLKNKISDNKKDATNTILQKSFPGGSLLMRGANSASGLRSIPAERLMLDEPDAYPQDVEGEGSPIKLAEARNRNFKRGKVFMPSTPTTAGSSIIEREFEQTDQRHWHVPCPHCGAQQHLVWSQMRWVGEDKVKSPPTAYYECIHCQEPIYEKHKRVMNAAGEWIALRPENASKHLVGFHNNSLVSPWFSWEACVRDYLAALESETDMIVFTNTVEGKTSKASGEAPKWDYVFNKATTYQLNRPNLNVKFITMGVDVQKNRLALHIVGWGHDKRRWVLDYQEIVGDVETDEAWGQLRDMILNRKFIREDGLEMPIRFTAIDSGNWAQKVYEFCKPFPRTQVAPIKGRDELTTIFGAPTAVNKTEAGKKAGNVMLYMVGSSLLKKDFYAHLRLEKQAEDELGPPGYVHLHKFGETYFKGLVAEEERISYDKGTNRGRARWFRLYGRNEPLDTMNYARAAAAIVGMDRYDNDWMDMLESGYVKQPESKLPEPPKSGASNLSGGFWGRRT